MAYFFGCPLLAQSGHRPVHRTCPLLGVKRTWRFALHNVCFDPKRTWAWRRQMSALTQSGSIDRFVTKITPETITPG